MTDKPAFEALLDRMLEAKFERDSDQYPSRMYPRMDRDYEKARAAVLAAYEEAAGREGQPVAWANETELSFANAISDEYVFSVGNCEMAPFAVPLFTHPAPKVACSGVPDSRCDYLMTCGHICNKCGRVHDKRILLAAPPARGGEGERNQCDGCATGAPIRDGLHVDASGRSYMACQRERYRDAAMSREAQ